MQRVRSEMSREMGLSELFRLAILPLLNFKMQSRPLEMIDFLGYINQNRHAL